MRIEQSVPHEHELVAGLAHRMNNILTLFHGYVGLLLDNSSLDKGTRASLAKIKDGACAATELIDRTHSLVRPARIVEREIDLAQLLSLLRPMLQELCGPGIKVILDTPPLPALWSDHGRLKTALAELVRNASDATRPGGTVRIETARCSTPEGETGEWISLSVVDNGHGISPDTAARMFHPFYSTRKQQQATGLGLNVASEAVQQLGGLLTHHCGDGETRFSILLPLRSQA